jgi:hypothetical protein
LPAFYNLPQTIKAPRATNPQALYKNKRLSKYMKLVKKKRPRIYRCKFCRASIKITVLIDGVRACPTCYQIVKSTETGKWFQLDIFGNLNPITPKQ